MKTQIEAVADSMKALLMIVFSELADKQRKLDVTSIIARNAREDRKKIQSLLKRLDALSGDTPVASAVSIMTDIDAIVARLPDQVKKKRPLDRALMKTTNQLDVLKHDEFDWELL